MKSIPPMPMLRLSALGLLCLVLVCGCGGPDRPTPKPDLDGLLPTEVVRKALEAATAGDFEKASSYATLAYANKERESRAEEMVILQQWGWPAVIRGVTDPKTDLSFRPSVLYPDGVVEVPVRTPTTGEAYLLFYCVERYGKWRIGLDVSDEIGERDIK